VLDRVETARAALQQGAAGFGDAAQRCALLAGVGAVGGEIDGAAGLVGSCSGRCDGSLLGQARPPANLAHLPITQTPPRPGAMDGCGTRGLCILAP
jgi:hypothetical protein